MLSLIIPTFNRPHFLARLLLYLGKLRFQHRIVVADSSVKPMSQANRSMIREASGEIDVRHIVFRPGTRATPKIAKALTTVHSKYSAMCADDDFVVPKAIDKCVEFLENNEDYVVAHGDTMFVYFADIREQGRKIVMKPIPSKPSISKLWALNYTQPTNDMPEPSARLRNHLLNYCATFYSVHRRLNLMRNFQLASENTWDLFLGELLPSCLSVIQGKVKHINTLYAVRPCNERDLTSRGADRLDLPDLLTSDEFSRRYARLRDCLASELATAMSLNGLQASEIVNQTFLSYMVQYLQPRFGPRHDTGRLSRAARRTRNVAHMIPTLAKTAVVDRQILFMLRRPLEFAIKTYALSPKRGYIPVSKMMRPDSRYRADFLPVYEYLERYPHGINGVPHSKGKLT